MEQQNNEVKPCSKCKRVMPFKEFRLNDYGRPISWCKECERQKEKLRYERKKSLKGNQTR